MAPLYKKSDSADKKNYRPISVLPSLSNVYEKTTQHFSSNLLFNWKNCLNKSGEVGIIILDLSKTFDILAQGSIIAKLRAYGIDYNFLRLRRHYLSYQNQRI